MKHSNQTKASVADVKLDIHPFVKRSILSSYVKAKDVTPICHIIRCKYSNVDICPKPDKDGYPYLMIRIGTIFPTKLEYEIRTNGMRNKTHDPLNWINRIHLIIIPIYLEKYVGRSCFL